MFQTFHSKAKIESESHLAAACFPLIDTPQNLSFEEMKLVREALGIRIPSCVSELELQIHAGGDPLGEAFCKLRSPQLRRKLGATYTPGNLIDNMMSWASKQSCTPKRIVDPGAGSGRFIIAAASRFADADLFAVELDPLARLVLRANLSIHRLSSRTNVVAEDYREFHLPKINPPTLFIGNPPFVHHHDIDESWKAWFAVTAAQRGYKASKLAGLHVHFFLRTLELAAPGDIGTFVTSSEWLDVNYGSLLRSMLAGELGGTEINVLNPGAMPFSDAMTTAAVTCFRVGNSERAIAFRSLSDVKDLNLVLNGSRFGYDRLRQSPKWSFLGTADRPKRATGHVLGDLFRVHRGQVTGANRIWVEPKGLSQLPERFLFHCVTRARELFNSGGALLSTNGLKRVLDLPGDLDGLDLSERQAIASFLAWAKQHGAADGFVARNRRAWWSVGLKPPAPILVSYMARRNPVFVVNACGARHINIAHGLYPREPMSPATLHAVAGYLSANVGPELGRTYAGGLLKFEPKEIERLEIPRIETLLEAAA